MNTNLPIQRGGDSVAVTARGPQVLGMAVPYDLAVELQKAEILWKSNFFPDIKSKEQAAAKIIAGLELGIGAVQSLRELYIVKGRVSMSATLMAGLLRRSGRYDFDVLEHTNERCEIQFIRIGSDGERVPVGSSPFSMADARAAGLTQPRGESQSLYTLFPRNMLWSRAMSNGVRWYCAEVLMGSVYTPDELGAVVEYDDAGNLVRVKEDVPAVMPPRQSSKPEEVPGTPEYVAKWATRAQKYDDLRAEYISYGFSDPGECSKDWTIEAIEGRARSIWPTILSERAKREAGEPPSMNKVIDAADKPRQEAAQVTNPVDGQQEWPDMAPCQGCGATLTAGQRKLSIKAWGKPLCPTCQKADLGDKTEAPAQKTEPEKKATERAKEPEKPAEKPGVTRAQLWEGWEKITKLADTYGLEYQPLAKTVSADIIQSRGRALSETVMQIENDLAVYDEMAPALREAGVLESAWVIDRAKIDYTKLKQIVRAMALRFGQLADEEEPVEAQTPAPTEESEIDPFEGTK